MERHALSPIDQNYFKVDIEYLQRSQLLVVAKDAAAAEQMVKDNILETTEGFKVLGVAELTDEEKEYVIKNMMGVPDEPEAEVKTDDRVLN